MRRATGLKSTMIFAAGACLMGSALWPASGWSSTQYINSNAPAPLEIAVQDSGTPGVWVNQPNGRTYQYFNAYAWGTIVWLNGTNTGGRYTTGYRGSPTTNSPVSNAGVGSGTTNDPYVITTVVKLGTNDVYMRQQFSYVNGDRYFTKNWTFTNAGAVTYTDLRLFHGGDAFFGGMDNARSWWDEANQKLYLSNINFVNCGYMAFYPNSATPAARYYGGNYNSGNSQAATFAQLSNTTDSAYTDAGYYLQWNKPSLAPGRTWTVEAYEYWSQPGPLAVLPAANAYVEPGSTVIQNFLVHNLSATSAASVNLAVTGADWSVSLPGGTNLELAALAVTSVSVRVVVPADAAADVVKDIALTALSGVNTGAGASRLTVYIPAFTITPNPLDFGAVSLGATSDLTITLSNDVGAAAVTVGTIADTLSAPFAMVADNASGQIVAPGGSCSVTVRFAPTSETASAASFAWPIVAPAIVTRTVAVQGTGGAAANGWLAINVTPTAGSWQLTAPAGYTGPTSGTGSLAAVSATTGSYSITWGALSGYVAPSNQSQFVTGGSTTLFTGVYISGDAPANVLATDGWYPNKVAVAWDAVGGATGYQVWRHTANDSSAATQVGAPATNGYTDTTGLPGVDYYYWIKAVNASATSGFSEPDTGWRRTVGYTHYQNVDIDGDGKMDMIIYDPLRGTWYAKMSKYGYTQILSLLGGIGCTPVWGDYDGDGLADAGIYEEANGEWTLMLSTRGGQTATAMLGGMGYAPVPSDFDGDRKTDIAVYQQATGNWTVQLSGSGYVAAYANFGGAEYKPVQRDYDGDGKADPAVYRRADGNWYFMLSDNGYLISTIEGFGGTAYVEAPGDYDGDRVSDPGVYQESTGNWYVMMSGNDYLIGSILAFGGPSHTAMPGDYDGDGKTDPAVYNFTSGEWAFALTGSGYAMFTSTLGGPDYDPIGLRPGADGW